MIKTELKVDCNKDLQKCLIVDNGTILTPERRIDDGILIIRDSQIIDLGKRGLVEEPPGAQRIDAGGNYIVPGFVNIHVHGGKGVDFTKLTAGSLESISDFFAGHGVTSFLATILTCPDEIVIEVLDHINGIIGKKMMNGANILGVHMEGPYLNPLQSGAHPRSLLSLPDPDHYHQFLEYSDVLRMMTLAPELDGAEQLVRDLRRNDIIAAAGHTDGIFPEMVGSINAGITHATHFFCNMSHFRRDNLKRVAGAVETLLDDDRITGELIADGWHLDASLMKLLIKVKGCENVCFITDGMPATGLPDGRYFMGEVEAVVEKGVARLPDNSAYAGSVATMDVCIRNGISLMDLSLQDSVKMATQTPARIIKADKSKGSLEKFKDADINIIDGNGNVLKTLIMGREYHRDNHSY